MPFLWEILVLITVGNVLAGLVAGAVVFRLQEAPAAEEEAAQLKTPLGMVLLSRSLRMWSYYLAMLVLLAGSILAWASIWSYLAEAGVKAGLSSTYHLGIVTLSWIFYIFPVSYLILLRGGLGAIIAFERRCQSRPISAEAYHGFFRSLILRPAAMSVAVLSLESIGFIMADAALGIEGVARLQTLVNYSSLFVFGLAWLIALFLLHPPRMLMIYEGEQG